MLSTSTTAEITAGRPRGDAEQFARYALYAEICKVLTDPKRLMVLDALRGGEKCVGDLADEIGMRLANASQHLSVLRKAGLIEARREATTVYYRLCEPRILAACDLIHEIVGERLGRDTQLPPERHLQHTPEEGTHADQH